ncbi:MAG: hypothetical protein ACRD3A_04815 [Terriglobales bacterium]
MAGNNQPAAAPPPANPTVVQIVIPYDRITKQVQYQGPLDDYVTLLGMLDMARLILIKATLSKDLAGPRMVLPASAITKR